MEKFKDSVPFDPGYSAISFSFIGNIDAMTAEYARLKANHQKKFWLTKFEPMLIDLINKSTAFYLGCMLWGGFLRFRFKDSPKEISGNHSLNLSDKEKSELDCTVEVRAILEHLEKLDKDFKYFIKRPLKIRPIIKTILDSYIEFADINKNFTNTKKTDEIKIPKIIEHFAKLSEEKLDNLYGKISEAITLSRIEELLEIGFYTD